MRHIVKRGFSLLIILSILISLFAGLTLVSAAGTYNNGAIGVVCTSLSSQAKAYYTGSYTYSSLSAKSGSTLKSSISSLVNSDRQTVGYNGLKTYFARTDAVNGSSSKLRLFYCGVTANSTWDPETFNREHMWPKSLGGDAAEGDLHSMRPTDPTMNSTRNNHPYGNVTASSSNAKYASSTNGSALGGYYANSTFMPLDSVKGDVARSILYDYCTYSDLTNLTDVFTSSDVLLEWIALDPVDEFEMTRNDVVEDIQGCRNPFVDYPDLAWKVFNKTAPSNLITPSNGTSSYTVTASSNNTSYGTVSVSGNVITATPKTGYYASGYSVLSGTATVSQDGNVFTVNASSNCSIRINFAAKTSLSIKFSQNGSVVSTKSVYSGDAMTLPDYSGSVPSGYSFAGWTTGSVSNTTSKPSKIYAAGASYTPTASATLYALYTYSQGGTGGSTEYTLTNISSISSTDSVVITMTYTDGTVYALSSANGTSDAPTAEIITVSGNKLSGIPADALLWNVGGNASGYTFYPEGSTDTWLYCNNANNGVRVGTGTNKTFTIDSDSGYLKNSGASRYVGIYRTNPDWRCYTSINTNISDQTLGFYTKGAGGTTYYTTTASSGSTCSHSLTTTSTVPATCTTAGSTIVTCNSCGTVVNSSTIAATGHNYQFSSTIAPTASTQGYDIYTCTSCSNTEYRNYTEPLAATYTVSFVVPAGVTSIADRVCSTITLPVPSGTPTNAPAGTTFAGWVTAAVDNSTTAPSTVYNTTTSYTVSRDITFYALYTYDGSGRSFQLYDGSFQVYIGDSVILVASGYDYAMSSTQSLNNRAATAITRSSDGSTIVITNEPVAIFTLGWGVNGNTETSKISFQDSNGYLCAASSSGNYLRSQTTLNSNGTWTFSRNSTNNTMSLVAQGSYTRSTMQYNSSSELFACYSSASQTAIQMFVEQESSDSSTAIYTTVFNENTACQHSSTSTSTTPATCTTDGKTTVTCNSCGEVVSTTTITATGHTYSGGSCTVCGAVDPSYNPGTTGSYEGRYYIATKRSSGNYWYMTSDLGTSSTERYQAVDSGLTTLPDSISGADAVSEQIFVLERNSDGTYSIYAESVSGTEKYLGHTSDNSGTLVEAASAVKATVDYANDVYNIHYTASDYERYLALNGNTGMNYFAWYRIGQKQDLVLIPVSGSAGGDTVPCNVIYHEGVAATCTQTGTYGYYTCADPSCEHYGKKYADEGLTQELTDLTISKLEHNMVAGKVHAPTCTEEGYTEYACSYGCGATDIGDIVAATGHSYTSKVTTAATCEKAGVRTYTCSVCGSSYTEAIAATGHNYTSKVTAPTCTAAGYTTYTCSNCGDSYTGNTVAATGHSWNEGTVIKEPTETATGERLYTCKTCGATKTEEIPTLDHSHKYSTQVIAPTCTEAGYTLYTCTCGDSYTANTVAATGHSYTYSNNADNHIVGCSKCDYSATEDHTYTNGSCICGAEEVTGPIPASELVFMNKALSLQSYIAFDCYVTYAALEGYDSWYVVFERYDYEKGTTVTETVSGEDFFAYAVRFEYKVNSYQMSDTINATIYAVKDGKTYVGETYTNSVAGYVNANIANASSDAHATVYANLVTYGAKAQVYMKYNVENLADAGLGEYASYVTTTVPTAESVFAQTNNGLNGAQLASINLGIAAAVEIQTTITLSEGYSLQNIYGEMVFVDSNGKTVTQRVEGTEFDDYGVMFIGRFNAMTAVDGRTPVEITIYDLNGNAISETWTYSVASYLDGTTLTGDALAVLYALVNYYDSAAAFF